MFKFLSAWLAILLIFTNCNQTQHPMGITAKNAMVVSARAEASEIGLAILKKGGNAFDAMIATELALAVAYPYAGNIGGGGFMVYRLNNGKIGSLDYREKAPLAAYKNMYLDSLGHVIPDKSIFGAMAVGVPGTIAGIFATYEKFGTLPITQLFEPVIALAQKGVVVTTRQAKYIAQKQTDFKRVNVDSIPFMKPWKAGDTIKYPAFAQTLKQIMLNGKDEFYKGQIAQILVQFIQKNGGIITLNDLAAYEAKWRNPVTFTYDDLRIISMGPPSSGGVCLAQIMKMIEPYPLNEYGHNSVKSIQLMVEAERRSYADRSYYLGDPDFVHMPIANLISASYAKHRMADFSFNKATPSSSISHGSVQFSESTETTHYAIVDSFGNAVSVTTTLNGAYGSKLYCNTLGFFLNNEMDDFVSKPGKPNMFGLVGGDANSIAPEKRMLSSMTPTIVEKNGKLYLVLGTPGGSTIITSVLQTIVNIHEFGMGAQQAVSQPRFHHQWLPDTVYFEPNKFNRQVIRNLKTKSYAVDEEESPVIGKVAAILVRNNGWYEGGADPRGDDTAIGF